MVYLLHFFSPLHHARHYLGYCSGSVEDRIKRHRAGDGSRLVRALLAADQDFVVARTWPEGDRALERLLKRRKNAPRLCPICNRNKRRCASKLSV